MMQKNVVPENIHKPPWKVTGNSEGEGGGVHRKLLFQRKKKHKKIESNALLIPSTM